MSELKMCPFCGGEANNECGYISCKDPSCGGFGVDVPVESWNRRPVEDALEAELAPFRDPYFKGLDMATIAELAKKSIRLTTAHCQDRDRIAELEERLSLALSLAEVGGKALDALKEILVSGRIRNRDKAFQRRIESVCVEVFDAIVKKGEALEVTK